MDVNVGYDNGSEIANGLASVPTTLTTSEADVFKTSNSQALRFSRYSLYYTVTLGAVANVTFKYYYSIDNGVTWYSLPTYNTSTGAVPPRPLFIDSTTYANTGVSQVVDVVTVAGGTAFKVTGVSATGTPAFTVRVNGRFD